MRAKKMKYIILVLVLLLSIGFAVITTNLFLNGSAFIGYGDFDVRFSSANTNEGTATISNDGLSITFSSKKLTLVGETSTLDYTITNYSKEYDTSINVSLNIDDETYNDYYTVDHTYPSRIDAKQSDNGRLRITLNRATLNDVDIIFTLTITATAGERTSAVNNLSLKNQSNIVSYVDSTESLSNPDRGMYTPAIFILNTNNNKFEGYSSIEYYLNNLEKNNNGLMHVRFDLSALSGSVNSQGVDLPLNNDMIASMESILQTISDYGYTAIVRFSYDYAGEGGREPLSWSTIENHIETIAISLNKYKKCIASVDAGFLGKWGEMHSSGIYQNDTSYLNLISTLLDNLDSDIKINVRKPYFYQLYFGSLTPNSEDKYRIGIFDDGMFGSESDLGTFESGTRSDYINWLNNQAKYTLYGGEVTRQDSSDSSYNASDDIYSDYPNVIDEMYNSHTTYLNSEYNLDILQDKWNKLTYNREDEYKGKTVLKYITDHLGYRYVVRTSLMNVEVQQGNELNISLEIENTGFAPAINEYDAYLIIKKDNIYYEAPLQYDIRNINSKVINYISFDYSIPSDISTGFWDVYIKFNKKNNDNSAIRFANPNIYDSIIKANKIGQIEVKEGSTSNVNFVQLNVDNAVAGTLKTAHTSNINSTYVRVSSASYDFNDNSKNLGNAIYYVQPGTTINYADPTVRASLGIIIPQGYKFHDVRSTINGWQSAQSITIPNEYTNITYSIEIYLEESTTSFLAVYVYDENNTRLSITTFREYAGTVIDLSDFSSLSSYGINIPDDYHFVYGTSGLVNWTAITTFEVPDTDDDIYLEIHVSK